MHSIRAGKFAFFLWLSICAGAVVLAADSSPTENWSRFRGADGSGVYAGGVPLTCDVKTGANVAWTATIPAEGFSSPVVWGQRVFLTGGDEKKREVMCFDLQTGALLWERAVPKPEGGPDEQPEIPDECGMAASTPATDGQRVYAMFTNGDLAAVDFDGKVVWSKHIDVSKNPYGHATSLLTWQGRLIVQCDQGKGDDGLSKLYAFDGATGAPVWEKPRAIGASWATPIAIDTAGKAQLVTLGLPWVIAYAAKDGAELWRAECLDGEVTPSPIMVGGTLVVISPTTKLQTIRPDGAGDVTKTNLGWSAEDGIPAVSSPVSNGELIFVVDAGGVLTCYDAKDGKKQWDHDLADECHTSPSLAGGQLYLITKKGTLIVVEAAREFKELARSELGEPVVACPAFAQGRLVVRGAKRLICSTPGAAKP